jgi:hypothetical protein
MGALIISLSSMKRFQKDHDEHRVAHVEKCGVLHDDLGGDLVLVHDAMRCELDS